MSIRAEQTKVLIVEDDLVASRAAQMILESKGCLVDCVFTGKAAIDKLNEHYDLIVLDLGLPDIHGFEVAKIIRKSREALASAQIVVLTAFDMKRSKETARDLEIASYFSKPFTLEKCEQMLKSTKLMSYC